MQTVLYDGSFAHFLCAVFDVYEYRYADAEIVKESAFLGNMFASPHRAVSERAHSDRVWRGLEKKLSREALDDLYRCFLSELPGMENTLLRYIRHVFASSHAVETDFAHEAVITVVQTSRKVWREKHRMEAFVRFQQAADGLFFALVEPDHNVLPLIADHFASRYADQHWLIYDQRRNYGIHYNGETVQDVQLSFSERAGGGKDVIAVYDEQEEAYQQLWQQYFKSVNIAARKNTKLHLQHMPRRYGKYLPEKRPAP